MEDLPTPAPPIKRALVPRSRPPPSSASSSALPLIVKSPRNALWCSAAMGGGKVGGAGVLNFEVVMPAGEGEAAFFHDAQASAVGAVLERELLQHDDAV